MIKELLTSLKMVGALEILNHVDYLKERDQFLSLAHGSLKWDKWLLSNTQATDYDKAVMAGHYVFATSEFREIKNRIASAARQKGFDLDTSIRESVKSCLRRYVHNLNLV